MSEHRRSFLMSAASAGAGIGMSLSTSPSTSSGASAQSGGTGSSSKPGALDFEKFRAAVLARDVPAVSNFLERDPAVLYARDAHGNSVYTLACLAGQKKMAEALAARGLVLDIFEAAGNAQRATDLLKTAPGLVHARSVDGRTPLHYAAATGQPDMVMLINSKGADLSAGPESPLLAVADYPDSAVAEEMAQTLLANASDPNARRKDGASALHIAAARGHADVVWLLLHRGASAEAKDGAGRTPLEVATGEAAGILRNSSRSLLRRPLRSRRQR